MNILRWIIFLPVVLVAYLIAMFMANMVWLNMYPELVSTWQGSFEGNYISGLAYVGSRFFLSSLMATVSGMVVAPIHKRVSLYILLILVIIFSLFGLASGVMLRDTVSFSEAVMGIVQVIAMVAGVLVGGIKFQNEFSGDE